MSLLTDENKTNRLIQNISMSLITLTGVCAGMLASDYVSIGFAVFIGMLASFLSVIPIGYGFYYFSEEIEEKYTVKRKLKALEKYKDNEDFVILTTDPNTRFIIQFHRNLKGVTLTRENKAVNRSIICKIFSNNKFSSIFFKETQKRYIILPKEKTTIRFYCKENKNTELITQYVLDDDSYESFKNGILILDNFLYDELLKQKKTDVKKEK